MDWISQAGQLILSLSILVVLHECGHFIPARLFKTRVEKFYLFFDPWFSLFKYKKGDTEYGIGWLPLGGYVKISGMIDESMDKEQMSRPAEPWEFRAKPAWQRLIIMVGGVTVNAILAIAIFIGIAFVWGTTYIPNAEIPYGVYSDSAGQSIGIQTGDRIISIGGKPVDKFKDIRLMLIADQATSMQVMRDGREVNIDIPIEFIAYALQPDNPPFVSIAFLPIVDEVSPGSKAEEAGLLSGDRILAINDIPMPFQQDVAVYNRSHKSSPIKVDIERNGESMTIHGEIDDRGFFGYAPMMEDQLPLKTETYTLLTAIPAGFEKGADVFSNYIKQLKLILNPKTKAYEQVGGFGMIGKAFDPVWDWSQFWTVTAVLSVILAIMNILPIPALDGGHVMFLLYEIITGRKPHEKVMEYAQIAGMILLLSLILYANGNDIVKMFR